MCVASPRLTGKLERRARRERQVDARCTMAIEYILELLGGVLCGCGSAQKEFRVVSQARHPEA